jgi:hypothetical protein
MNMTIAQLAITTARLNLDTAAAAFAAGTGSMITVRIAQQAHMEAVICADRLGR